MVLLTDNFYSFFLLKIKIEAVKNKMHEEKLRRSALQNSRYAKVPVKMFMFSEYKLMGFQLCSLGTIFKRNKSPIKQTTIKMPPYPFLKQVDEKITTAKNNKKKEYKKSTDTKSSFDKPLPK